MIFSSKITFFSVVFIVKITFFPDSGERVFRGVEIPRGSVVVDVLHSKILEDLKQRLSAVVKGYSAMVREAVPD